MELEDGYQQQAPSSSDAGVDVASRPSYGRRAAAALVGIVALCGVAAALAPATETLPRLASIPAQQRKELRARATAWTGATSAANGTCVEVKVSHWGRIVLQLTDDATPKTVANFLEYVDSGFYNSTIFHRVISKFMIQGGAVTTKFVEKSTRAAIVDEAAAGLQNLAGTVAMARYSAADSATDSFYINVVDNTYLDYSSTSDGYCAFGAVVAGFDVAEDISKTPTHTYDGWSDVPVDEVVVSSMARTACP